MKSVLLFIHLSISLYSCTTRPWRGPEQFKIRSIHGDKAVAISLRNTKLWTWVKVTKCDSLYPGKIIIIYPLKKIGQ